MTAAPAGAGRVLVAGDWHGNREWAARCFEVAARARCDRVLQLGDFGLWPGREDEWLDHVDALAGAARAPLVWLDGNHENHASLRDWRAAGRGDALVRMRAHVEWAPRGARWEWAGVSFGALGGAVSIDRFLRRAGVNWWEEETPTQADVDRLGDAPLDVLVTHASPSSTALTPPARPVRLPGAIIADALRARALLDQAVARVRPALILHGHHHTRLSGHSPVVDGVAIEGLAHDKSTPAAAMAVLDLARRPLGITAVDGAR